MWHFKYLGVKDEAIAGALFILLKFYCLYMWYAILEWAKGNEKSVLSHIYLIKNRISFWDDIWNSGWKDGFKEKWKLNTR